MVVMVVFILKISKAISCLPTNHHVVLCVCGPLQIVLIQVIFYKSHMYKSYVHIQVICTKAHKKIWEQQPFRKHRTFGRFSELFPAHSMKLFCSIMSHVGNTLY